MNKKLVVIIQVMTASLVLNGMDVIQLKNLKRTKTAEGSQSRRQDGVEDVQDTRLNFETLPEPLFSSANGKRSVKTLKHVSHLKTQQNTFRDTTARASSDTQGENRGVRRSNGLQQYCNNNDLIVKDDNDQKNNGLDNDTNNVNQRNNMPLHQTRTGLEELPQNNRFSEQDMWDLLKKSNPRMYAYAIENDFLIGDVKNCPYNLETIDPEIYNALKQLSKKKALSLDEMMEYVHLLEEFNIDPEAIGSLLQKQHGYSDNAIKLVVQKFESIQKNDKEAYIALALDFLTRTCGDDDIKDPSPIHAAHVAIQNDTIATEKKQKWYSVAGNVIFALASVGMAAWGAYGQFTAPTTQAPTNAPTTAPTMFPTGSPT